MGIRNEKGQFVKGMKNGFESFLELGRKWKKDNALTNEFKKERGWYFVGKIKYFWKECDFCREEYQGQGSQYCSGSCRQTALEEIKNNRSYDEYINNTDNFYKRIRNCKPYKNWRNDVYKKDMYTCVLCKTIDGQMNIDHYPKTFMNIIKENKIDTLGKALECDTMWDVNNGRVLCLSCHKQTDTYGNKLINKYYV
jgi:hypothetical protein